MQRLLQVYPEERHSQFDPSLLAQARMGARLSLQQVVDAQVARRELAHAWTGLFQRIDLLITPTVAVPPFPVGRNFPDGANDEPNLRWSPYTATFNLARLPAATVPCGLTRAGLPVGLHVVGPHYRDALVLAAVARFQRAAPLRFPVLPSRT
jgi:aspartyl-tRNA(Asn)/glutamyl-tRNA(Gln) amidotransferase subunit A